MTATSTKTTNCAAPYSSLKASTGAYTAGTIVSSTSPTDGTSRNYECKPFPFTEWCKSDLYQPGVSRFWNQAWELVNECYQEVSSIHSKGGGRGDEGFKEPTLVGYVVEDANEAMSTQTTESTTGVLCPAEWNVIYTYDTGDRVTLRESLTVYECKEPPFNVLCSNTAYEVGKGPIYEHVWKVVGRCVNGKVVDSAVDGTVVAAATVPEPGNVVPPVNSVSIADIIPLKVTTTSPTNLETSMPTKSTTSKPTLNPTNLVPQQEDGLVQDNGVSQADEASSSFTELTIAEIVEAQALPQDCDEEFDKLNNNYELNQRVSFDGSHYTCTLPSWCGMPNFEPAIGKYWKVVWDYQGPCGGAQLEEALPFDPLEKPAIGNTRPVHDKPSGGRPVRPTMVTPAAPETPQEPVNVSPSSSSSEPPCPPLWVMGAIYAEGETIGAQGRVSS